MFTYQINLKGIEKLANQVGGRAGRQGNNADKLIRCDVGSVTFVTIVYAGVSTNKN